MTAAEKAIEKARKQAADLATVYNVPVSKIVWTGNNHFIIVIEGEQVRI